MLNLELSLKEGQEYHVWIHDASGDAVVRTTAYSLPEHLHDHIELVQPTTMFSRTKALKTTLHFDDKAPPDASKLDTSSPPIDVPYASSGHVDASCNQTITLSCLLQLYNAEGFAASGTNGNKIGITGYLDQFANKEDLQLFYKDQLSEALDSSFETVLIDGA